MVNPNRQDHNDVDIPGTIYLVDVRGQVRGQHASEKSDIVLVPQPSKDPEDPLNWNTCRKLFALVCMCIYTFIQVIGAASITSVYETIISKTSLTLTDLNEGFGYIYLLQGWGCLFWQPLAIQYGKRPVYLFTLLANCALLVWIPYSTVSRGQFIGTRILQGFFGAPIESLCEVSVTDLYFQHERGFYIAIYGAALVFGALFAPLIGGFIGDGQGWQWVLYWSSIFAGAATVFLFFFMEETNYPPRSLSSSLRSEPTSDPSKFNTAALNPSRGVEKTPGSPEGLAVSDIQFRKRNYWNKLSLFQRACLDQPNRLLGMVSRPLAFLSFPVVFYSGFAYGCAVIWYNVLQGTASLLLTGPPYHFRPTSVGLSFISAIIGAGIGAIYAGSFGDRFVLWLARRREGILEPEYRLWLYTLQVLLVPFGLILWGVGAAHEVHWIGPVFGMGALGAVNVIGVQLSISYCVETYRALSSEALVTMILVRNTMIFAVNYGLTPWVQNLGYQNAFLVAAFVGMAETASFLIFVLGDNGKQLRRRSGERYSRYLKGMRDAGMAH